MRSREEVEAMVREEFARSDDDAARKYAEQRTHEEEADEALLREARERRGH